MSNSSWNGRSRTIPESAPANDESDTTTGRTPSSEVNLRVGEAGDAPAVARFGAVDRAERDRARERPISSLGSSVARRSAAKRGAFGPSRRGRHNDPLVPAGSTTE